jgi:protein SCO1/2
MGARLQRIAPLCGALLLSAAIAGATGAYPSGATAQPGAVGAEQMPGLLAEVGFDQRLGESVPLDLTFRDERGGEVRLGDFFGTRPVVLLPVYYDCPMLCTMILNGFASGLMPLDFDPGEQFEVVVVSFNPRETPEQAAATKERTLLRYGRPETAAGWHFLTGDEEQVRAFTDAIGFRYQWDEAGQQYAHAAGIVLATPDGVLSHYLLGIEFAPRDLRLGLVEAADGEIGSLVDQALLYCFQYDPAIGRYSAVTMNIIRLGGVATVVVLTLFITFMLRRDRKAQPHPGRA